MEAEVQIKTVKPIKTDFAQKFITSHSFQNCRTNLDDPFSLESQKFIFYPKGPECQLQSLGSLGSASAGSRKRNFSRFFLDKEMRGFHNPNEFKTAF
jgi:hypothetical protein